MFRKTKKKMKLNLMKKKEAKGQTNLIKSLAQ